MVSNLTKRKGVRLALAAFLTSMTACEQNVQSPGAGPEPEMKSSGAAKEPDEAQRVTSFPVEDEVLKALLTKSLKGTHREPAPGGSALEKSAAQNCLINFNNFYSLSAMPGHAYAYYAVYPWYTQPCGSHTAMVTPTQGNYYYLIPTEANVCIGNQGYMGYGSGIGSTCPKQKDAALFPRAAGLASPTDANVGLAINDVAGDYYRNFLLKTLKVNQGPVYVYGFKNPGGWIQTGSLSAGTYTFNWDNLGQVVIRTANGSGQFLVDDISITAY